MPRINLSKQRFGRLLVTENVSTRRNAKGKWRTYWECICDCGNRLTVLADSLRHGNTKSCGCFRVDNSTSLHMTHGLNRRGKRSREYGIWSKMKGRCLRKTDRAYPKYGGRGITVCERWLTFENFIADMGSAPPDLTLERIDNEKGYEPDNCKWATRSEQSQNTRQTTLSVDLVKEIRSSSETSRAIAKRLNIPMGHVIQVRCYRSWKNITVDRDPRREAPKP